MGSKGYEHYAGEQRSPSLGHGDVAAAEEDAEHGRGKGYHADDGYGEEYGAELPLQAHANAHGEGVNAGGDGKEADDAKTADVEVVRRGVVAYGVEYHLTAHYREESEGYPVVDSLDDMLEGDAEECAEEREGTLKQGEGGGDEQRAPPPYGVGEGTAGGDDERVNAEGKGEKQYLNYLLHGSFARAGSC